MPTPKRQKNETASEYRHRLYAFYLSEGREEDQAWAIAYSKVPAKKGEKKKDDATGR